MLFFLDTADIKEIVECMEWFPVDGITCNPSIVLREDVSFLSRMKEIRHIVGLNRMLHIQVLGRTAQEIEEEAEFLKDFIGGNLYIKIPVFSEGIKAIRNLSNKGFKTTATTIFTPIQALVAAKAGADFVGPYINRLDNIAGDSIKVTHEIVRAYENYSLKTRVIASSFKNVEQVHRSMMAGAHGVTVSPEILRQLIYHPLTEMSINSFINDWESHYGKGVRTHNLKEEKDVI